MTMLTMRTRAPAGRWLGLGGACVVVALGCGAWNDDPKQRSNRSACTTYVADLNERVAGCGLLYEAANLCSSANYPSVDMVPYYTCLVAHTRCDRGELLLEVDGCEPPLLLLADTEGEPSPPAAGGAALR